MPNAQCPMPIFDDSVRPAGIEPALRRIMSSLPPQSAKGACFAGFQVAMSKFALTLRST